MRYGADSNKWVPPTSGRCGLSTDTGRSVDKDWGGGEHKAVRSGQDIFDAMPTSSMCFLLLLHSLLRFMLLCYVRKLREMREWRPGLNDAWKGGEGKSCVQSRVASPFLRSNTASPQASAAYMFFSSWKQDVFFKGREIFLLKKRSFKNIPRDNLAHR